MDIENLLRQAIKVDLDAAPVPQKINHAMSRIGGWRNAACHAGAGWRRGPTRVLPSPWPMNYAVRVAIPRCIADTGRPLRACQAHAEKQPVVQPETSAETPKGGNTCTSTPRRVARSR